MAPPDASPVVGVYPGEKGLDVLRGGAAVPATTSSSRAASATKRYVSNDARAVRPERSMKWPCRWRTEEIMTAGRSAVTPVFSTMTAALLSDQACQSGGRVRRMPAPAVRGVARGCHA